MRLLVVPALLAACLFAPAAHAADKKPTSNVSGPVALKETPAVRVAKAMMPREQWDQIWEAMASAQGQMVAQLGKEEDNGAGQRAVVLLTQKLKTLMPYEEMLDLQAGLLQKYYTAAELKQLEAFYTSDVGKKSLRISPDVMQDMMGAMQEKLVGQMPRVMQEIQTQLEKEFPQAAHE